MFRLLFLWCSAFVFVSGAWRYQGDECSIGGETGVCKILNECQTAREAFVNRNVEPTLCFWQGNQQVVCCIGRDTMVNRNSAQRTTSTTTTTEYEPELPDYGDEEKKCPELSSNITAPKTGRKAWDKCVEYQESYVYPCRKSFALGGGLSRQNFCHQGSDVLVLGGEDAGEFEFPHMVLLGYLVPSAQKSTQVKWECAGTIISEYYVLTAAHCTSHREYKSVRLIRTGTLDRSSVIKKNQVYWVAEIIKHPEYASPLKYNDIALLKTTKPIQLDSTVMPACLDLGTGVSYDRALISGWGDTRQGGGQADRLQKVILTKFSSTQCRRWYGKGVRNMEQGYLEDSQICYGDQQQLDDLRNGIRPDVDYKDACQGDSGGPAQVKNSVLGCMYTVVGLTSFGKGCGNAPGIYTRVSRYVPWIENIVWPDP